MGNVIDCVDDVVGLNGFREAVIDHQFNVVIELIDSLIADGRDGDQKEQGGRKGKAETNTNLKVLEHTYLPD